MAIRAVAVDLGGVLERVADPAEFLLPWLLRLGMTDQQGASKLLWPLSRCDPDGLVKTGAMTEASFSQQCATALGLTPAQTTEFMADLWVWYSGELDAELASYLAGLRPRYRTGILSNSMDGARREEQRRHGLEQLVDVIVYSHEIGVAKPDAGAYRVLCDKLSVAPDELVFLDNRAPNVAAASQFGIHSLLHVSTTESIAAIDALRGYARPAVGPPVSTQPS